MFLESSEYYDKLYSWKDYGTEAERILHILAAEAPQARRILDVACGTAEHHRVLSQYYPLDGIDLNESFLEAARRKNPQGRYFRADMTHFALDRRYDAVLCLFSSIGYAHSRERLRAALSCLARHLAPGGLVLVEPWFDPATFRPGTVHLLTHEEEDLKICRLSHSTAVPSLSRIEFHYLVATPAQGVRHFTERHELGLYTREEMLEAFTSAGLAARHDPEGISGRGLYLARPAGSGAP